MAITISANHSVYEKGLLLEISQVCAVPNGGSVILTEEEEKRFKNRYPDGLPDGSIFKVTTTKAKAEGGEDS